MEYGTGHLCVLQLQVITRATTDEFEEGCAVTHNKIQTRLPKEVCFADWHGGAQLDAPKRLCLAQLFQPFRVPGIARADAARGNPCRQAETATT